MRPNYMASSVEGDVDRVLGPDGSLTREVSLPTRHIEAMYRTMVLARTFDEKAVSLHRQGRVGTYAPLAGQEAAQVGAAAAMAADDLLFPTYRDHAMYLERGLPLSEVVVYLLGEGNYVDRQDPADVGALPPSIPIATHLPHAVGAGMAANYTGDDVATLASFGDGATSEGDFHEALNFAGVFESPTVFFCQNNGYAISVPVERQTASATLAQKAHAYGFDGIRVDGNDVLAVYQTVRAALEEARTGNGPTMIEAVTYRQGAHTTTDDPERYREAEEVERWAERDPLDRTREHLEAVGAWGEDDEAALREWAEETVAAAVATAEAGSPRGTPDDIFECVYAEDHPRFPAQREAVVDEPDVDR